MVFPPTAPWWSAGLTTPQGSRVPFAGRRLVGCKTSARWAAVIAGLLVFPPTAPWWSAGLKTPQGSIVPFAGRRLGGMQDLGTLGGSWSDAFGRFRRRRRGGRLGSQRRRAGACLSLDGVGRHARPRHAGRLVGARANGVSADGAVVVGGLKTPQGSGVPFAGRRWVGCRTSARCRDT
jgi:hypothetical protein